MTPRRLAFLCAAAAVLAALPARAFPSALFQFRKPVVPAAGPAEVAALPLDADVCEATTPAFAEVRLAAGTRADDVPFVLEKIAETRWRTTHDSVAAKLVTLKELPQNRIVVEYELAEKAPAADGLTFSTPLRDYEHSVRVEGSADGREWTPLVADAVIFDYTRYMDVANRDVAFPANTLRRFRIEIGNISDETASPLMQLTRELRDRGGNAEIRSVTMVRRPFRIDAVQFWRNVTAEDGQKDFVRDWPVREFKVSRDEKKHTTTLEIGMRREPLTAFTLVTSSRNFSRPVTVQVPGLAEGRTQWREVGSATLSSVQFQAYRKNELEVGFPEQREREYRLVIQDADNPPLEVTAVKAAGPAYHLLFLAGAARDYRLYYAAESAESPRYDLDSVLAPVRRGLKPVAWTLGPQEPNPDWRRGSGPFWKRLLNNKTFFTGAVILMVAVLGWVLYHSGKRIGQLPPEA